MITHIHTEWRQNLLHQQDKRAVEISQQLFVTNEGKKLIFFHSKCEKGIRFSFTFEDKALCAKGFDEN